MKYQFYIVDVFSPEPFGGNQLAVLPNAQGISTDGMLKITGEFNFAESAFVFPPEDDTTTARVRIFTPKAEVDFAGHPTVGTACALVYGGHVQSHDIILEENVGPVSVKIEKHGSLLSGALTITSPLDNPAEKPEPGSLARILSLNSSDIVEGFFASAGLNFCFAKLTSAKAVDRACLDKTAWNELLADAWSPNIFFFAGDLKHGAELYARMFAPALGIEEDPATGSAVAALVGVAALENDVSDGRVEFSVLQGVSMGRISKMAATARMDNGKLVSVGVGGATSFTATGEIEVSEHWLE